MPKNTEKTFAHIRAAIRRGATAVPIVREIPADTLTPVAAFLRLHDPKTPSFLLESVEGGEHCARYSFLGTHPFETLRVENGEAHFKGLYGAGRLEGCPFKALGQRLTRYRALPEPDLPPFCGGAVGNIGYEMVRHLEPSTGLRPSLGPEAQLQLFGSVAAFDQIRHRLLLISNVLYPGKGSLRTAYLKARDRLDEMEHRIYSTPARATPPARRAAHPRPRMGAHAFRNGVRRIKQHIRAGDIFQAVLSDRFDVPVHSSPFSIYRQLRTVNPSPYMFYMGREDNAMLGASPEMLVRVQDGQIETRPIAGTRPRGTDREKDRKNERNLLASVKERAEHLMLVDLGRNDVGRVARPGSVAVPSFMEIERYSHVMHIVSSVRGRLRRTLSAWDAFAACFPAGTVSGAPKIRAMQILSQIEPDPRGLYAGAVVYHDFHGNLDSAIAIRSISVKGKRPRRIARIQAGAGIVADSRPDVEWKEIRAKAGALFEAVRRSEEGR